VTILETERLALREFRPDDDAFILELLNEAGWLRYIGDRGLRTREAARDYIVNVPMSMYARCGFGLWAVQRKDDATLLGMCGLIRRETLADVDIGFAFLDRHQGRGYAYEAAAAVVAHGRDAIGLSRIVAITALDNAGIDQAAGEDRAGVRGVDQAGRQHRRRSASSRRPGARRPRLRRLAAPRLPRPEDRDEAGDQDHRPDDLVQVLLDPRDAAEEVAGQGDACPTHRVPPLTSYSVNLLRVICATPATNGAKVRRNGMKRATTMVIPP
jgi:RimJ/RimL family protein N-acetyltransferase